MRPPLSYVPALFPLVGFIAGMLLSGAFNLYWFITVGIGGIVLICVSRRLPEWSSCVGVALLFCGAGGVDMIYDRLPDVEQAVIKREEWQGEVIDVSENDRGIHLVIRPDSLHIRMDVLVHTLHGTLHDPVPGDIVRFRCELLPPVNENVPGAVDYVAVLSRRGISATGFSDDISVIGHRSSWRYYAWRARTEASSLLMRSGLSNGACSFLLAVLVGDDDWLSQDTRDMFSAAGVAHVLALSGLHVGIIIMALGLLLLPLGLIWDWRVRCGVIIIVLWGYAFFTGLSAPVTRASLMASLMCGGIILQRPYVSLNGMLVSALIILMVAPRQLWTPGFQLSYLAVGSILVLMPAVMPWLERVPRVIRWFAVTAALSLAAMLATAMLAMYYFQIFPVYFLLANIPVALVLPVLMVGGLALMVLEAVGFDAVWLCSVVDWIYMAMLWWVELITDMPSSTIRCTDIHGGVLLSYYIAVCVGVAALYRRTAGWGVAVSVCVLAAALVAAYTLRPGESVQWFIPRNAYFTTVICRMDSGSHDGGLHRAVMYTTAPGVAASSLNGEYRDRYRTFIERFGSYDSLAVDDSRVVTYSLTGGGAGKLVIVNHDSILGKVSAHAVGVDCALICRGYRGSWKSVADSLNPHMILLSADIPKRRHIRLLDSISTYSEIPVISLREGTFSSSDLPDISEEIE